MENAARALEIAAGVLIGVLLMALIVYFFKTMGEWPQQQDDMMSSEQTSKFNLEYEVYGKKGMYGVDVISCLNKAKDNNDKYLPEAKDKLGFLASGSYPDEYVINVFVHMNDSKLKESLEVYYIDQNNATRQKYEFGTGEISDTIGSVFGSQINFNKLEKNGLKVTNFQADYKLSDAANITEAVNLGEPNSANGYYSLLEISDDGKHVSSKTVLEQLLQFTSTNLKVTVQNTFGNCSLNVWSSATWTTALYDLKTKRFKCEEIKYSEKTGRVNEIYFSEL